MHVGGCAYQEDEHEEEALKVEKRRLYDPDVSRDCERRDVVAPVHLPS